MESNWRAGAALLGVHVYGVRMAARLLERPEGWPDLDPYYVERLDEDPPLEYVIAAVADPDFPAQGVFRFPIDPAHPHFPYGWKVSPDTPV